MQPQIIERMMGRRFFPAVLLMLFLSFSALSVYAAEKTPSAALQACVSKLSSAKSLKAGFTASISGRSLSGTLLTKGQKFAITMPGLGSWYDGKTLWSYNAQNKETAMWYPTKAELAESNPLLYLSSATDYTVKDGTGAKKGERVLILTPKKRNSGVKSVIVTINTATNLPKVIKVSAGSSSSSITLNSVTMNPALSDSQFSYPKKSYPGVPVIDLR